jgi:hypothetical protein
MAFCSSSKRTMRCGHLYEKWLNKMPGAIPPYDTDRAEFSARNQRYFIDFLKRQGIILQSDRGWDETDQYQKFDLIGIKKSVGIKIECEARTFVGSPYDARYNDLPTIHVPGRKEPERNESDLYLSWFPGLTPQTMFVILSKDIYKHPVIDDKTSSGSKFYNVPISEWGWFFFSNNEWVFYPGGGKNPLNSL